MDDGEMSRSPTPRIADNFKNVRRVMNPEVLKRLRTYEWDKEVLPGITAVGTPGHTPGHTSHVVSSGGKTVYVQADVTHAPFLFARHPGWHAFYDHEPVLAEATRRKVYDMLAAEKMMVQGFHYPFPSVAMSRRPRPATRKSRSSGIRACRPGAQKCLSFRGRPPRPEPGNQASPQVCPGSTFRSHTEASLPGLSWTSPAMTTSRRALVIEIGPRLGDDVCGCVDLIATRLRPSGNHEFPIG